MAKEPEPKVEPQPTPQPDPVPPTIPENMIPQSRMNEVVGERNTLREELAAAKTKLEENATAQKLAEDKKLETQGEFEELYKTEKSGSESLTEELKRYEEQDKKRWELLLDSIPEEKRKFFPEGESKEQVNANIAKYDEWVAAGFLDSTSIPSIDPRGNSKSENIVKGEFGGYKTRVEWAENDPVAYGKYMDEKQTGNLSGSMGFTKITSKLEDSLPG